MKLYEHQKKGLEETKELNRVAYYWDMGTGKTFVGSEKMLQLGAKVNLIICQKSKIDDWYEHFHEYYFEEFVHYDLTNPNDFKSFLWRAEQRDLHCVGIINYELAWRRSELLKLKDFTLMLDESSMIQNEKAKRSKFILKMQPENVILLSGTPTGGKYEKLWSQMHLLGWPISKSMYWQHYIKVKYLDTMGGRSIPIVVGYKNVDRLKSKMREYGCQFLKTEDVFDLPKQNFQKVKINSSKHYRKFKTDSIVVLGDGTELVGDTTLTKMLYERQLCGKYSLDKIMTFKDLIQNTDDRLIVFYNFTGEVEKLATICDELKKPVSVVNGKEKDLENYEQEDNSITFIQYQAGAMGLNLQKANKIIYFTPPLSSELFEQSKKRIHRIGQENPCFYYMLTCKNSIEERIYKTLEMRKDFTEKLFESIDNI